MKPPVLPLFVVGCAALDNGLARTPQMGYNSWYDVMGTIDELVIRETADAMVSTGLYAAGYNYINLDDCWAERNATTGKIMADPTKWTDGSLKAIADYVHSKGLLFGTYTDRGTKTCAGRPAAQDHEVDDAKTYAEWGVDYLKEDSCNAPGDHDTAFKQYGKMRDALNATGRPVLFSLCGWNTWYAPVGQSLGNSWRIGQSPDSTPRFALAGSHLTFTSAGPDDTNWAGVLKNIDRHDLNAPLGKYAGPGGWNDPCLLLSDTWQMKMRVTEKQSRTQFAMWAVMASPLLISGNVRNMSNYLLETYKNKYVIAVSQDPLGVQGSRVAGGDLSGGGSSDTNVWARPLINNTVAAVFLNNNAGDKDVPCDDACFTAMGFKSGQKLRAINVWEDLDYGRQITVGPGMPPFTPSMAGTGGGGSIMVRFCLYVPGLPYDDCGMIQRLDRGPAAAAWSSAQAG